MNQNIQDLNMIINFFVMTMILQNPQAFIQWLYKVLPS